MAEFLRRRLFGSGTSVIMTSATLATKVGQASRLPRRAAAPLRAGQARRLPCFLRRSIPQAPVGIYARHLPHWRQEDCTYFVTFSLGDSIPQEKLRQWEQELEDMASAES